MSTTTAGRESPIPALRVVREAAADELAGWDDLVVDVPGGDVQQSLAWGRHRAAMGSAPHHLVLDDGSVALVLARRLRLLGGGRAYVPRGPVGAGAGPAVVAGRLAAITAWARDAGFDVVVADPQVPAASGLPVLLAGLGFRQVEEVGPARHRVGVAVPVGASEADLLDGITPKTRQQLLAAERRGLRIRRYDLLTGDDPGPGTEAPPPGTLGDVADAAFLRFHDLLVAAGERRGFDAGSRPAALAWWRAALAAGHLLLLEARGTDDEVVGGAVFFRHGGRLTYGHSADAIGLRSAYPGTMGLILWRALQLVAREGRTELDLGGVDVRGARRAPLPGEPTYGLLRFKESLGGRWIELTGTHERVLRRARHAFLSGAHRTARGARELTGTVRRSSGRTRGRAG
ncbi:MAG TPA: GNAT family N-acetyltransferase [Patescibacteria group bacterium]|nr:GNAT family N-acetyltransferase [Patescibacteria group bacterium]